MTKADSKIKKHILILIASPAGCGKTFVGRNLAGLLQNCTYIDLDSLNMLSSKLCEIAGEPFVKETPFFRNRVRDSEYDVLFQLIRETLPYSRFVVVTAPFTKEMRNRARWEHICKELGGPDREIVPVWVMASPETCLRNLKQRGEKRDGEKLKNPEEWLEAMNFSPPDLLPAPYIIDNRNRELTIGKIEKLKEILLKIQEGE